MRLGMSLGGGASRASDLAHQHEVLLDPRGGADLKLPVLGGTDSIKHVATLVALSMRGQVLVEPGHGLVPKDGLERVPRGCGQVGGENLEPLLTRVKWSQLLDLADHAIQWHIGDLPLARPLSK